MILIINKSLRNAILVADLFHYMGMLAYPATYEAAPSEVRSEYRTFLLYEPTESASELVDVIRKVCTASLIIEIRKGAAADPYPRTRCGADAVLDSDMTAAAIAAKLDKIRGGTQRGRLSEYGTADLITDFGDSSVIFGGKRIRLTKTELMIVKFLVTVYPTPMDARSILKYAFRRAAEPELANIRTHISVINRKALCASGEKIINSEPRIGYTLNTKK